MIPTALAMAMDHCFTTVGLHRIEATIRPENRASRRVVEKLGFHEEGIRRRCLHVDGAWRDHICYALTAEDVGTRAAPPLAEHRPGRPFPDRLTARLSGVRRQSGVEPSASTDGVRFSG